ncbi:hypothetical protein BKA62DRAFT_777125 [Auriculariales sp. MPI-PUGE-AT-0066]|nr:hypothetical protein BKA62DRAFT_777125 [Auriculariales sp. MPI-PUGE-AT-0066]
MDFPFSPYGSQLPAPVRQVQATAFDVPTQRLTPAKRKAQPTHTDGIAGTPAPPTKRSRTVDIEVSVRKTPKRAEYPPPPQTSRAHLSRASKPTSLAEPVYSTWGVSTALKGGSGVAARLPKRKQPDVDPPQDVVMQQSQDAPTTVTELTPLNTPEQRARLVARGQRVAPATRKKRATPIPPPPSVAQRVATTLSPSPIVNQDGMVLQSQPQSPSPSTQQRPSHTHNYSFSVAETATPPMAGESQQGPAASAGPRRFSPGRDYFSNMLPRCLDRPDASASEEPIPLAVQGSQETSPPMGSAVHSDWVDGSALASMTAIPPGSAADGAVRAPPSNFGQGDATVSTSSATTNPTHGEVIPSEVDYIALKLAVLELKKENRAIKKTLRTLAESVPSGRSMQRFFAI